jgi:uncharacterized protein (TIGR02246 family)
MACVALVTSVACASAGTRASSTPTPAQVATARAEILAMMQASARAWTRGDLDGFMRYYAPDTTTTFVGRNRILRGRAEIRTTYASRFTPGGPPHDSLSFENVEIDVLAPDVANVLAYYRLSRGDSTVARGPTSVVVRRDPVEGWRIIHDHSS